ncbi:HAMP domain-containing histidine kinase [Oscillatoria sp. FACHB-1407]|uniref:sensor histidine kinase n=1 Tax=Oscillatoria sp. FACHB-1407 TaxID=2692847 RepID=UPI0016853E36|nr:HAMP domain-containing sensor histidine kinase [Oscillatoria sp. FACHB-1407]MBD2462620.1 HAMP domain-containing histidine kinase [Oscillatoria sp. FACHB-1407]
MTDFSEILRQKIKLITENWVEAVRQDSEITTTQELTYESIRNSLPKVLEAMATILSQSEVNDVKTLVDVSLEHGILRSEQGFEPSEIAREYRILRSVLFSILETDLVAGSPTELLRAVRLIDTVIDEAIARCFDSYTQGRLRELEQLQSELKLTNQELTRLVRANQSNLAELAHELKTPLTSIIGYSDLFLRQHRQEGSTRDSMPNLENIERVLQSGRQLLRLINDSLEISRYESGTMKSQFIDTEVTPLIRSVVEMVKPLTYGKALDLQIDCDRAPQQVATDPLRLQQVLTNLLSNAIRYTKQGTVQLTCQVISEQEWTIIISDSGMGIAPEDQQAIFQPYIRGQVGDRANVADSTGLGLAIVDRLVKLLNGRIYLASQLDQGSTFTVILPLTLSETQPHSDES